MDPVAIAQDHPLVVNALLAAGVVTHLVITQREDVYDLAGALESGGGVEVLVALHLGILALGGGIAGFAGVVVIFGLTMEAPRFRRLRRRGGGRLRANWASVVTAGFLGAFLATLAAVLTVVGHSWSAVWVGELALLLCAHGAARLIWLLRALADTVDASDRDAERAASIVPAEELFGPPPVPIDR